MRPDRKWISELAIAAIVIVSVWQWLRPLPRPPPEPELAHNASPLPESRHYPVPPPLRYVRPAPQAAHPGIDICGVGNIDVDPTELGAAGQYLHESITKTRLRWLVALNDSDDYRARAAGLVLEGMLDWDEQHHDSDAARNELVQLALGTNDPAIFALANAKCALSGMDSALPSACAPPIDQWARADPDNAVPWLVLAGQARRHNDSAAEAAAWSHAAQAHHYDSYTWSLVSFAQASIPSDATAAERWFLKLEVFGVAAAMPMPYGPILQYCSGDAVHDDSVRRQCEAVAELMVGKSTNLLELGVGKSLGARAGWSPARIEQLTNELHASLQALNQTDLAHPEKQWNCESVARGNAFMSDWDRLGERGAAKEAIERSGASITELARQYSDSAPPP